MNSPIASIIIACREVDRLTKECVERCLQHKEVPAEILVLPDQPEPNVRFDGEVKVIPTGKVKPSAKRNRGVQLARGSILAFIDSDAVPAAGWLANACRHLEAPDAGCVGGPNVNPPDDSFLQKASGDVYATYLAMGRFHIRYRAAKSQDAVELPSCNLIVKRDAFEKVGGFDETILTGEDAKLCFQIRALGQRVLYRPDVVVFHHRRPLFLPHARQVWQYAVDKSKIYHTVHGWQRWYYWSPTLLIAGVLLCVAGSFIPPVALACRSLLLLYLVVCFGEGILRSVPRFAAIGAGIIVTHFAYGIGFLAGLLRGNDP
jgi:cellulose synthase/poly-beta-1,6-N-acetylglucosamine synthase-like glycosyltransferase